MKGINRIELGNVENEISPDALQYHLFIITREGDSLVYHAEKIRRHRSILRNGVPEKDIMGGGMVVVYEKHPDELCLKGESGDFGNVPNELMKKYSPRLLELYKETLPQLERVVVDLKGNEDLKPWLERKGLQLNL